MGALVQQRERVAFITIERPPLNVLDVQTLRELDAVVTSISRAPSIDVLVFQGAGERAFSAGVDIRDHTKEKVPEMLKAVHAVIRKLLALPQVTIASIRGLCLGGGCELASSCDLLLAAEDSSFAPPEIQVGCYPPVALARFSTLIGYHRAAEMILTGRRFSAHEARNMGLVNRVVANHQLQQELESLINDLLGKSGAVLRITLKGLRELSLAGFSAALRVSEEIYCTQLLETADVEEGIEAFLQKRQPRWTHK
jgi:cyclohexa-1,5-dienecarbonyl-CoA hydratase